MDLSTPISTLNTVFGYNAFRGLQQQVIDNVCAGKNALVLMPTGAGKSLCYQVPALVRSGTAVVVSPLIALMQDQVTALQQLGVKAVFLNSSLDYQTANAIEQSMLNGEYDLVYVAPERLVTERFLNLLDQMQEINLFAIDEAHCVSQWGHDFRPEYQRLSVLVDRFPYVPRIALTATADEQTRQDIIHFLALDDSAKFISSFDRPNIRYSIVLKDNARQQLLGFINTYHKDNGKYDAGVVYCMSRKKVDATAEFLSSQGINALPYHAGMSQEDRQKNQKRFINEEGIVMVATIAFGMGIDKPNVRFVAHLDLPKSIEAYYQETGRAGRDGLPANAWMAYGLQDVINIRQMLDSSTASENQKYVERQKLEAMLGLCEISTCRRKALLTYFNDDQISCGNCDNCLTPPETWNGTEAAQKVLSCVYRTEQRYGVGYLIKVLQGSEDEDVKRRGHDQLSVYGIGKDLDKRQWQSVFRQLVAMGYLAVNVGEWNSLRLTEEARPVLRGEVALQLRKEVKPAKASRVRAKAQRGVHKGSDQVLWEALRSCRLALSKEYDVPPYVIFHDATLMEMLEAKPQSLTEMASISGVGETKLEKYGGAFLDVIAEHKESLQTGHYSDTVQESINLFRLGMDITAIAERRALSENTILNHLGEGVEVGDVTLNEVVNLPDDCCNGIEASLLNHQEEDAFKLKPVFDEFEGKYSYGEITLIKANLIRKLATA